MCPGHACHRHLCEIIERVDPVVFSVVVGSAIGHLHQETAGTLDPAKVRDALAAMDTETFFGRIKFGATGQISSLDPPVFQLQGGKPVVIFPDYVKQAEFKFGVQ